MNASIIYQDKTFELDQSCSTVLEAIQAAGIEFAAACGGRGTCKKCAVWVRDAQGLRRELACRLAPSDSMSVFVEEEKPMAISEKGIEHPFAPDDKAQGYGLAIDVGTTTVVVRLCDLASGEALGNISRPNPQMAFGADVIARISACSTGHLNDMKRLIGNALEEMAGTLCTQCGVEKTQIERIVLAGNTVMESIAAGVDPESIGVNPFIPLTYFGDKHQIGALAQDAYFVRCLSGYVGGDITADIIACDMTRKDSLTLMLDLGTNGEMALGNCEKLVSCATAAGPVFEGANITYGMPARTGAISRVKIDDSDIAIATIDDTKPFGICGTGIIDAVAVLLQTGIIDETGFLNDAEDVPSLPEALAARIESDADGVNRFRLADGIYLTQADVRSVQLAKAAICAGIYTMLDAYGASTDDVDELLIAGGFGKFLNIESAACIGLFPLELADRARSIGNAAIEGADALLVSSEARKTSDSVDALNNYIELSTSTLFNQRYVDCMMFE